MPEQTQPSESYSKEAWERECAGGSTEELIRWNTVYVNGNPLGWDDEIIDVLRAELRRRMGDLAV
jgi:hypothetical protein